jgi:hypothetical protein
VRLLRLLGCQRAAGVPQAGKRAGSRFQGIKATCVAQLTAVECRYYCYAPLPYLLGAVSGPFPPNIQWGLPSGWALHYRTTDTGGPCNSMKALRGTRLKHRL